MPIYEYKCAGCGAVSNHLARSFAAELQPVCPRCQGRDMTRLMSRPALIRTGGGAPDPSSATDGDMAGYMRRMRDSDDPSISPEMRDALDATVSDLSKGGGSAGGELWGSSE